MMTDLGEIIGISWDYELMLVVIDRFNSEPIGLLLAAIAVAPVDDESIIRGLNFRVEGELPITSALSFDLVDDFLPNIEFP